MRPSLCLSDSGTNMKRRIEGMFLNKRTKRPVKAAVTIIVLMLAAVCFTSACAPAGPRHISNVSSGHTAGVDASTSPEHSVNGEISAMFSTEDGKNYYVITDYPGTDDETVYLTYDYSPQAHDVVEKYETDYVAPISLTDREKMFAGVFANPGDFLAFNYKTSKAGAYVWLEEYNYGVRSKDGPGFDSFVKGQKGSIIFSKIVVPDRPQFYLVMQSASDRMGYAGSLENVNDVSGYIKGIDKETSVSGDVLLGCFVYKDGNLSDAFFSDYNTHLDELKNIPEAFLIKCRFLSSEEIDSMKGPA
jgi:hypothetical protein